ncbi:conjugal transfer protein [Candidatus Enterococcus leclercqii]|uniref:conjugal transfer protein n=1 Tax=Candidatus Enterococcus leclercqii TaxID=1857218 RepID=UPI00137A359C|nr:conjugal transfer protein [Enterococcus sp. CU9D]KAF1294153.1 hypothetical protein BAU14_07125 [Enterococcus sp. CU9D]
MAEKKPVFNPQAVQTTKKAAKKSKKKRASFFSNKEKVDLSNTRTLRFAPRTAQSIFSVLFFFLFVIMCVIVLMTFGRVDHLTDMAMSKQVNQEDLVLKINTRLIETDQLHYEGEELAKTLYTAGKTDEERQAWETEVKGYLAPGLNVSQLELNNGKIDRTVSAVSFIKMETLSESERTYRLFYKVSYTEADQMNDLSVVLPVSYQDNDLKLIDLPAVVNLEKRDATNPVTYDKNRFIPKGTSVSTQEEDKLTEFVNRFFDLYGANDDKLELIAAVSGIGGATVQQVNSTVFMKLENGNYFVQGTYLFQFEKQSTIKSKFSLEIKQTEENYYVLSMNGE